MNFKIGKNLALLIPAAIFIFSTQAPEAPAFAQDASGKATAGVEIGRKTPAVKITPVPLRAPGTPMPGLPKPQTPWGVKAAETKSLPAAAEVTAETAVSHKGAVSYQLPSGYSGTFEASIEKLYLKKDDLPDNLVLAPVAKMKTNPQLSTTKTDFEKIAREAFRGSVSTSNWRVAHTSFYKGKDAEDDTIYICVAVEYKRETNPQSFAKDIELLKLYLKKETSDEYVLLEKFPFMVVMGSNQIGDYEFATVKEIASRLKIKLFGAAPVEASAVVYPAEKPASSVTAAAATTEAALKSAAPASSTAEASVKKNSGPEIEEITADE
ncbi:MAG TPA: hypothetical protein PKL57_21615, partial [Candidatus Wallbacteria bacterium]|nr:hypothetical protein [Candidatus Wallbacteria bacterium]